MAKQCAYCDCFVPLTREHVWPDCFLERFGLNVAKLSLRSGKVHGADYVVRDVCSECSSVCLSTVDAYFCNLYDQYFRVLHDLNATVEFHYRYDLLARALLKIAYNSSRIGRSDPKPLAALRHYVIGEAPQPEQLAIFLELVAPAVLEEKEEGIIRFRKVMPNMFHSALMQVLVPGGDTILPRLVAVNSFFFHILIPKQPMLLIQFERIATDFTRSLRGTVRLEPLLSSIIVHTSPQNGIQGFLPQMRAFRDQYAAFFAKNRRS